MRDFNGSLPGSTADHRHFASKKIQAPPGIIRGTNTQPSGSSCGTEGIHFYLLSGKHDAGIEYKKKHYCFRGLQKKIRIREKHRGSATTWWKFQGNTQPGTSCLPTPSPCRTQIFNILCLPPHCLSSPPRRVHILIKHKKSEKCLYHLTKLCKHSHGELNAYTQKGNSTVHMGMLSAGLKSWAITH